MFNSNQTSLGPSEFSGGLSEVGTESSNSSIDDNVLTQTKGELSCQGYINSITTFFQFVNYGNNLEDLNLDLANDGTTQEKLDELYAMYQNSLFFGSAIQEICITEIGEHPRMAETGMIFCVDMYVQSSNVDILPEGRQRWYVTVAKYLPGSGNHGPLEFLSEEKYLQIQSIYQNEWYNPILNQLEVFHDTIAVKSFDTVYDIEKNDLLQYLINCALELNSIRTDISSQGEVNISASEIERIAEIFLVEVVDFTTLESYDNDKKVYTIHGRGLYEQHFNILSMMLQVDKLYVIAEEGATTNPKRLGRLEYVFDISRSTPRLVSAKSVK